MSRARRLLLVVREMEWNTCDADNADFYCETPCYTVKPCDTNLVDGC